MKNLTTYISESQINEPYISESQSKSYNPIHPNVTELGIGEFDGALWGHCFLYEGKKYYSEIGWRNIYPSYCKMEINEKEAFPHQVDKYQRPELKELYEND